MDNRTFWLFVSPCVGYRITYDITLLYIRALVCSEVTTLRQISATRTAAVSTIIINHSRSESLSSASWRQYIWREINTLAALCYEINLA